MENINYFGKQGGYDVLFHHLKRGEPKCSLPVMAHLIHSLYAVQHYGYFPASRAKEYVNLVHAIVVPHLTQLTNEELKHVKKDDYELLVKYTTRLLDSVRYPFLSAMISDLLFPLPLYLCFFLGITFQSSWRNNGEITIGSSFEMFPIPHLRKEDIRIESHQRSNQYGSKLKRKSSNDWWRTLQQ